MNRSLLFRVQFTITLFAAGIFPGQLSSAAEKTAEPTANLAAKPTAAPNPMTEAAVFEDSLTLQEIKVLSTFQNKNSSPLRLNTIDNGKIRERATARTYTDLVKFIPSVYATAETGSYGDARINIRGFKQENISVLLNGVPISGLTSGNMFWNNWMGLTDATNSVQVQKGVGGSMLSDNSVGGTINIITTSSSENMKLEFGAHATHYGTAKGWLAIDSGTSEKGWSINLMGSYVGGKGYVDKTDVSSYAYMLNISKKIGKYNILTLTSLGSPEKHAQRSSRLSSEEMENYGLAYNKDWGYKEGQAYNLNLNNYFKPYFLLQHLYDKGKLTMNNSIYVAIGNGGGRFSESKGRRITSFVNERGQLDWDAVIAANKAVAEGNPVTEKEGGALNILSDYRAGHTQAGAIASATYRFDSRWSLDAGLHYQLYSTWENEVITDLLGGDYWYENYQTQSLAGQAGRNSIKKEGDYIRLNQGKVTNHFTAYAMGNYASEKTIVRLGVSGFGAANRRWDKYNYTDDIWSDVASGTGFSTKGGILYKPHKAHSVYLNGGYYSRLPYSGTYFASGDNTISRNVKNEKNIIAEAGYRFVFNRGSVEATGYYTYWKNKTLMSDPYRQVNETDKIKYMVTGLDALHYGVEMEAAYKPFLWLDLSAFASVGLWKWTNDVTANIYDNYSGAVAETINVYSRGLPVGDAPQTQVGAVAGITFLKDFRLTLDWQFNDRMYADFDPAGRKNPDDRTTPYRIPSYHLLNASLSWNGKIGGKCGMTIFINGYNLLDTLYIERGRDGSGHDLDTFRGFWGFGRNFNFGFRISLI